MQAPEIELLFNDGRNNYNVFVDGLLREVIITEYSKDSYDLALDGTAHNILVTKRTGPNFGSGEFQGIRLPQGGQLLSLPATPSRKIEFIGDSYTVGYGNEGPGLNCGGVYRPYENSYMSYASMAARSLNAQSHLIAISGIGAVRNYDDDNPTSTNPMPVYYNRTLSNSSNLQWDFSAWMPDAVVIKLGTNDHSTSPNPSADVFIQGIHGLIDQVNTAYGQLPIFLLADDAPGGIVSTRLSIAAQEQVNNGNDQVYAVNVSHPPQSQLGCDWHPLVVGHESMAQELVAAMRPILGW